MCVIEGSKKKGGFVFFFSVCFLGLSFLGKKCKAQEGFPNKPKFGLFFPLIFSKAYFEKKGKFPLKIRAYFWKNTK